MKLKRDLVYYNWGEAAASHPEPLAATEPHSHVVMAVPKGSVKGPRQMGYIFD